MRIAVIQVNSGPDKAANLAAAKSLIERAIERERPDLVSLPETFTVMGGGTSGRRAAAERLLGGEAYTMPQNLAREHGVNIDGVHIGLAICYDLRFAELFLALRRQGAQLIMLPAAFTLQTGKDHWEVLLRARAIETQCYFAAAAQTGGYPAGGGKRYNYGHALIADPWGHVVARASDQPGHAAAELDLDYLATVRSRIPAESHRRLPCTVDRK